MARMCAHTQIYNEVNGNNNSNKQPNIPLSNTMKFVINSSVLSSRLQTLGRVVTTKNTMPILESFLFQIDAEKHLTIVASDAEIRITTKLELVECDTPITFCVNARTIQDAVKEIPDQPLSVYINEQNLEITMEYQNGKYNFMGQSADEYPAATVLDGEVSELHLPGQVLYNGINRALFATADDVLRPVLNCIYFDLSADSLTMVASDGNRMACDTVKPTSVGNPSTFLLPKKPSLLIKNILTKEQEEVGIRFTTRAAQVHTSEYIIECRLVEGRFPKYTSVIPQDNPNVVTVNRAAMLSALRRVLIFANANSVLAKLHIEANKITLSSQDVDFSMSAEEGLLCDYNGMPVSIGFKGTYLAELLNNLEGEEVVIRLADASRAGVIQPAQQKEGENILMLLMPMVIND